LIKLLVIIAELLGARWDFVLTANALAAERSKPDLPQPVVHLERFDEKLGKVEGSKTLGKLISFFQFSNRPLHWISGFRNLFMPHDLAELWEVLFHSLEN
jgi:hypothetical protein